MTNLESESMEETNTKTETKKLAIGLECDDSRTQIITDDGAHLCYIEQDPHKEIAERIVETYNTPADVVAASIVTLARSMQVQWAKQADGPLSKKYRGYCRAIDLFLEQLGVQSETIKNTIN